jgi:hypothetical protein
MKTLVIENDYKEAAGKLFGQFPDSSHATMVLDKDTKIILPDGRISAVLICNVIPPALHKLAFELLKTIDGRLSNRATAVGTRSLPRYINEDGSASPRSGVARTVLDVLEERGVRQDILGHLDRPCRKTRLTARRPEMLDGNERLIKLIDQLYAQYLPTFHAKQWAEVEKVPRWRLWNTVFTTIYLGKNLRTAYHTDRGNLRGVMTAIMPMGKFTGGELVLARWRIAIASKPGDLLLFDPQQLHGNLPFEGERLSAAFYCAGRIADCGK